MIVEIRVDDRLIHGQVALVWTKKLNAKAIVVANDHASKDNIENGNPGKCQTRYKIHARCCAIDK